MRKRKKKHTLFKRLLMIYSIPIVLSFILISVLLISLFDRYFVDNKKEILMEQSEKIANNMAEAYYLGRLNLEALNEDINTLQKFLNASIWMIDEKGTIWLVSSDNDKQSLGKTINTKKLSLLFRGHYMVERGNFYGLLKENALTVGYPIFVGERFRGGVFIHASLPELKKTLNGLYRITIGLILMALILVYIGLYIQIKRITNPLKEIREATSKVASGDFQKRLSIKTNDEIEELGNSFNYMAESLEKIEENRRNLVANISHDLRTPMTSIIGFVEGIIDGTIPKDSHKKYLNVILDESKRMVRISNELVELSNMQQGITQVNKTDFDINELIRRKLVSLERAITQKELEVILKMESEKCWVTSDYIYVERIVQNLLDNAVKFTSEKGSIIVSTVKGNSKVNVEICNTGDEISQSELIKIWDRFHKGDSSRGQHKGGFGLGLAIVREMINQLGERITVDYKDNMVVFDFTVMVKKDTVVEFLDKN